MMQSAGSMSHPPEGDGEAEANSSRYSNQSKKKKSVTIWDQQPGTSVCACDVMTHTSSNTSGYRSNMSNLSGESGVISSRTSTSGGSGKGGDSRKKATLKKCIHELRSLMMPQSSGTSDSSNTVHTLQKVLKEMKKIKGVEDNNSSAVDTELVGGDESLADYKLPGTQNPSSLQIVLSTRDFQVLQVSPQLLQMLGYPKNYWFNQSLLDYTCKRDIVTLSSHLSSCSHESSKQNRHRRIRLKTPLSICSNTSTETCVVPLATENKTGTGSQQKNTLFFRLRHYKSLRQGFSLSRGERYTAFCIRAGHQKVNLSFPPGTPAEGLQSNNMYIVLQCTPLSSAFKEVGKLPTQRHFMTRQTIHCNYNFVHPAAIPLLGYLPQDFIGSSVFDYYHPRDLAMLANIYQQVIQKPGQMVKGGPYSLRTHNGEYISVETEWSGFSNPWTKQLDFIMGHHTVTKGPLRLDVFAESIMSKGQLQLSLEAKGYIKKIKSMLLSAASQTFVAPSPIDLPPPAPSVDSVINTSMSASFAWEDLNSMPSPERPAVYQAGKLQESQSNEDVLEPVSQRPTESGNYGDKEEMLYNRLNYAHNILRYLMSQVPDHEQDKINRTPIVAKAEESDCSDNEGLPMEMDLPIPRPPSCASSTKAPPPTCLSYKRKPEQGQLSETDLVLSSEKRTKISVMTSASRGKPSYTARDPLTDTTDLRALVSEQEREEQMPPSPSQEEAPEETLMKDASYDDIYKPVSLTKDALAKHTRMQEDYYIKHMMQERGGFVTPDGRFRGLMLNTRRSRKRIQAQRESDGISLHTSKYMRLDESTHATKYSSLPSMTKSSMMHPPFPMTQIVSLHTANQLGQMSMTNPISSSPLLQSPAVRYAMSMPGSSLNTTLVGVQWPCYQAADALSLMPPVLKQAGISTPSMTSNSSMSLPLNPKRDLKFPGMMDNKKKEQLESDSGSMETSSSLMYLLESNSSSPNNSCNEQEEDLDKKKSLMNEPAWRMGVDWSEHVEYRYQISVKSQNKIRHDNLLANLVKLKQSTLVQQQLAQLLDDCSMEDPLKGLDEEADVLFMVDKSTVCPSEELECADPCATQTSSSPAGQYYASNAEEDSSLMSGSDMDTRSDPIPNEGSSGDDVEIPMDVTTESKQEPDQYPDLILDPKMDCNKDDKASSEDSCNISSAAPSDLTVKSPDKLQTDSASESSDSGSKGSSNLTNSCQRSSTEAQSSLKESDNMSSESNSSKYMNKTESDALETHQFLRLWVPLRVDFDYSIQKDPPWIKESNFSESVQLRYCVKTPPEGKHLQDTLERDASLQQPLPVKQQFTKLVKTLPNLPEETKEVYNWQCLEERAVTERPDKRHTLAAAGTKTSLTSSEDEGLPLTSTTFSDESAAKDSPEPVNSDDKMSQESQKDSGKASGSDDKQPNSEPEELFETVVLEASLRKAMQASFFEASKEESSGGEGSKQSEAVTSSSKGVVEQMARNTLDEIIGRLFQEDECLMHD